MCVHVKYSHPLSHYPNRKNSNNQNNNNYRIQRRRTKLYDKSDKKPIKVDYTMTILIHWRTIDVISDDALLNEYR